MHELTAATLPYWTLFSRLGEAQILLPAALGVAAWLGARARAQRLALAWLLGLGAAAAVTTVTKVAFIGWGLGLPALDFTGVSGHAMFAAAVYPLLFGGLAGPLVTSLGSAHPERWQRAGVLLGCALALGVGVSRVEVSAHSWSEVIAGLTLGGLASAAALTTARMPHIGIPLWLPACVVVWLLWMPHAAPRSQTHDIVTRLSLKLSGHQQPYTRSAMLLDWQRRKLQLGTTPH
jgi:membrane-associated phospholipid phosphatase